MSQPLYDCIEVISCPVPDSLSDLLFYPKAIFVRGLASDILNDWSSPFTHINNIIPYCAIDLNIINGLVGGIERVTSAYLISSYVDQILLYTIRSSIYRVADLVSHSLYFKISQSHLGKGQRFFLGSMSLLLPYCIIYLTGHSSAELLIVTGVKIAASYWLKPRLANIIKQVDLIGTERRFSAINFIQQNLYTAVINLGVSIAILDTLFALLFFGKNNVKGVGDDGTLYISTTVPSATSLFICMTAKTHIKLITHTPAFFLDYFMTEGGWVFGKMLVDSAFILAQYRGLIDDLRDPFYNLWPLNCRRENKLKARVQQITDQRSAIQGSKTETPATRVDNRAQKSARSILTETSRTSTIPDMKMGKIRKGRIKPSEALSEERLPPIEQQLKHYSAPTQIALFDVYRNVTQILVPLNGAGLMNVKGNTWGVISCEGSHKKLYLEPFTTGLKTGHIGQHGAIKSLGKSKLNGKLLYELRPAGIGARIIGTLVEGENQVYQSLTEHFHYESVLPVLFAMRQSGPDINVINFDTVLPKHEKAEKYLREHLI